MLLTLLAAIPFPATSELGAWLISLAMVLIIADRARALFWPSKPSGSETVTRHEVEKIESSLKADYARLETSLQQYAHRAELKRLEEAFHRLAVEQKELVKSTSERYGGLTASLTKMQIAMSCLRSDLRVGMSKLGAQLPDDPPEEGE